MSYFVDITREPMQEHGFRFVRIFQQTTFNQKDVGNVDILSVVMLNVVLLCVMMPEVSLWNTYNNGALLIFTFCWNFLLKIAILGLENVLYTFFTFLCMVKIS